MPPITSFLLHARQQAADRAADPIPGAPAPAGAPRLPPLANSATDDGAADAPSVTATCERKGRGSCNEVARDERKRQRRAASLLETQDGAETVAPIPVADAPASDSKLPPSANSATDADAGAASPVAATRKRKGRRKFGRDAQDERKRQSYLLTLQDSTEAGT